MFRDRTDAGEQLAQALAEHQATDPVVLALPRGGLPVARVVADALGAPLDIVLVRKIGAPGQRELALGALVDGDPPQAVLNADLIELLGVSEEYLEQEKQALTEELNRRRESYLGDRKRADVAGKTAIVVDDGIATGATMRAALTATRRRGPETLVLAVPVAPAESLHGLSGEADSVVCLSTPAHFRAVSLHYQRFPQVSDDEVIALLGDSS
ncbi:MAG: phosphoribosyltransferase [Sphingomonadales bacterium]|nr:phosphoribosyltransferase [Sphingomonadales bacterium]